MPGSGAELPSPIRGSGRLLNRRAQTVAVKRQDTPIMGVNVPTASIGVWLGALHGGNAHPSVAGHPSPTQPKLFEGRSLNFSTLSSLRMQNEPRETSRYPKSSLKSSSWSRRQQTSKSSLRDGSRKCRIVIRSSLLQRPVAPRRQKTQAARNPQRPSVGTQRSPMRVASACDKHDGTGVGKSNGSQPEFPYSFRTDGKKRSEISLKALSGLARPAGIEPATPAFGGQYSIH